MDDTKASKKEKKGFKKAMKSFFEAVASPIANADQIFRTLGRLSPDGRGYLYQDFVPALQQASDNEKLGMDEAYRKINAKIQEIYGDKRMTLRDLYLETRSKPKATFSYTDGTGKKITSELGQGNLLYIYMVDKMPDGQMKLRRMGISEDDVKAIKKSLDPRLIEFADWVQEDLLSGLRDKYNEVHKRMFGTSMKAIENYFPLKIDQGARHQEMDVATRNSKNTLASTLTGAIIDRKVNTTQLDLENADAMMVLAEHIEQMEEWAAFAEVRKDINTLLSYDRFRNKVKHLKTIFGTGDDLFDKIADTMKLAVKKYDGKSKGADAAILTLAKSVSAAKVNFRVFTALKQFLSFPAYIPDTSPELLLKSTLTFWNSWKWAMNNLPSFKRRWESGTMGNEKLEKSEMDLDFWDTKVGQFLLKDGMLPNRAVDALTVSIGAKAIYDTRKRQYKHEGFSAEEADRKAKIDAELAFNSTQQSSEGLFLSTLQKDRTVASNVLSVFRNASMGYQRQLHQSVRQMGRLIKDVWKGDSKKTIDFMAKQLQREGLTEEQAQKAAKERYIKSFVDPIVRAATFGFLLQYLWNLASGMVYQLFGDDPDEKKALNKEARQRALLGGWLEGFAGGNAASELIYLLWNKESLYGRSFLELPLASDTEQLLQHMQTDPLMAATDLINLAVQIGIGSNPQTLTDAVVAIVDACNGDFETATEAMLCIMRILQVPQSQIDKIMIDEIGMTAKDGRELSYEDIARRYTEYKMRRNAPLLESFYPDELREKREKSHQTTFKKKVNERKKLKEEE